MNSLTRKIDGVDRPLYMLLDAKTFVPVKSFVPSNTPDAPATNPDSGVIYAPIMVDDQPQFDPVYQTISSSGAFNDQTGAWEITFKLTDRSKDEVHLAALNAKRAEILKLAPSTDFSETLTIVLAELIRQGKFDLSAVQDSVDKLMTQADTLATNAANLADIDAQIDAGGKPDIAVGYASASADALPVDIGPTGIRTP